MYLTDIHCHILPMVDDGPESVEEALEILQEAYEQGVRVMIVTPHFRPEMFEPSMKRVMYSYQHLRDAAREIGIKLRLGCECYRHEELLQKIIEKRRPSMAGSRYVLLEFSGHDLYSTIRNYIYEFTSHGYYPIIAHAERYVACQRIEHIRELRQMGALIQVNAASVLGEDGWQIKMHCQKLMKEDLIDFIASDTHNTSNRKMNLKKCASYVKRKMGKKYAEQIFKENPSKIWKNKVS